MNYITQTIEPWMPAGALKAKADMATIVQENGWQRLPIERYNDARFPAALRLEKINQFLTGIGLGDVVLHQFPTYMSEDFEEAFQKEVQRRGGHYVLLIHDFEPLRVKRENAWEWALAQKADLVVVHSPAMADALRQHGVDCPLITLDLFDYLGPSPATAPTFSKVINYAGTWQKAPWLKEYQGPALALFGTRPKRWKEVRLPDNIDWIGAFSPDDIALAFQSGFGLLWDSDYDDKFFQSYTQLNAPHKASLYLKAGLPLIVWSQSYLAELVEKEQIGFSIHSLSELNEKVAAATAADYRRYQENLRPLQDMVNHGSYTKIMLEKVAAFFK
ncbi:sugar transferase [Fructobacillus parabroussonetiae]|uniref:Sugar transferase n=1 Tax=Fructobacillus parabroussonetiae TaxID=2713174 RepID=A0ABS5QZS8_9LACO|nr:sugar transferase [Fructobacillus parabroussonetiae]MBS9337876.1 sugar transferase [Fructobacillus parabroussonetiae]